MTELYNKINLMNTIKTENLTSENIRKGINIFNIDGSFTSDVSLVSNNMQYNTVAYANGSKVVGSLRVFNGDSINLPINTVGANDINQIYNVKYIFGTRINTSDTSYYMLYNVLLRNNTYFNIPYSNIVRDINLNSLDIKNGINILGVTGSYTASTEFSGVKMDPVTASSSAVPLSNSITEVSGLDALNAGNMANFFVGLPKLKSVSNISMPLVTSMSRMFYNCRNLMYLNSVNMYNEDVSSFPSCFQMFYNCSNLVSIDNDCKFPKEITNAVSMFYFCNSLKYVNTPIIFNTNNLSSTFYGCHNLEDFSNFIFKDFSNMKLTFGYCSNINLYTVHNVNWLNCFVSNIFTGCENITTDDIEACMPNGVYVYNATFSGTGINRLPNIPLVYNRYLNSLYARCNNLVSLDNVIDTSATSLNYMFYYCNNLESVNLTFNFSNNYSRYMQYMFSLCNSLNTINLNVSDVSSANYSFMFSSCNNLRSANLIFNTSGVIDFSYTFNRCPLLESVSFSDISGGPVTLSNISSWDCTFYYCNNLVTLTQFSDICNSFVNEFKFTFVGCSNLVYNEPLNLDINLVSGQNIDAYGTFSGCSNITSPINLNINMVGTYNFNVSSMFRNSSISSLNLNINGNFLKSSSVPYINITDLVYSCISITDFSANINVNLVPTTFNISPVSYSPNIVNYYLNIVVSSQTNNMRFAFLGASNMVNFYISASSLDSVVPKFNYLYFPNTNTLSDESLDNILGFLVNINYTGSSKTLNNMGLRQVNNLRWESLSNYNNFINAGYSVGY